MCSGDQAKATQGALTESKGGAPFSVVVLRKASLFYFIFGLVGPGYVFSPQMRALLFVLQPDTGEKCSVDVEAYDSWKSPGAEGG